MNNLGLGMDDASGWFWVAIVVALVIGLMVRNQRQAYAYGVWDATHTPAAVAVQHVLNTVERRAWRDGEVAHLFATEVQLAPAASKRPHLL